MTPDPCRRACPALPEAAWPPRRRSPPARRRRGPPLPRGGAAVVDAGDLRPFAEALHALHDHWPSLQIADHRHIPPRTVENGDAGPVDGIAGELPDEGALPVPLDGERGHDRVRLAGEIETDRHRHAGLEHARLIGERRLHLQRPRRLVDAAVDRHHFTGEFLAGHGYGGGRKIVADRKQTGEPFRHLEVDGEGRHVVQRGDRFRGSHEVAHRQVGEPDRPVERRADRPFV